MRLESCFTEAEQSASAHARSCQCSCTITLTPQMRFQHFCHLVLDSNTRLSLQRRTSSFSFTLREKHNDSKRSCTQGSPPPPPHPPYPGPRKAQLVMPDWLTDNSFYHPESRLHLFQLVLLKASRTGISALTTTFLGKPVANSPWQQLSGSSNPPSGISS